MKESTVETLQLRLDKTKYKNILRISMAPICFKQSRKLDSN